MLNRIGVADCGLIGIEVGGAQGAALAQQVPALIQADLKLVHALAFLFTQPAYVRLLGELMFFADQFFNVFQDIGIVHNLEPLLP
jgi:hypothetical protein